MANIEMLQNVIRGGNLAKPAPTFNWAEVEALREQPLDPSWFTARQYQEQFKLKRTAAQLELNRMLEAGKLERQVRAGIRYYRVRKGGV